MAVFLSKEFAEPSDPAVTTLAIASPLGSTDEWIIAQEWRLGDPVRRAQRSARRSVRHKNVK